MSSTIVSVPVRVIEKPEPVKPEPGLVFIRMSTCPIVVAAGKVSAVPSGIKYVLVVAVNVVLIAAGKILLPGNVMSALPLNDTPLMVRAVANMVALPAVKLAAVPEMFVPTNALGVPKEGVTKVGELEKTTLPVPVIFVAEVKAETIWFPDVALLAMLNTNEPADEVTSPPVYAGIALLGTVVTGLVGANGVAPVI